MQIEARLWSFVCIHTGWCQRNCGYMDAYNLIHKRLSQYKKKKKQQGYITRTKVLLRFPKGTRCYIIKKYQLLISRQKQHGFKHPYSWVGLEVMASRSMFSLGQETHNLVTFELLYFPILFSEAMSLGDLFMYINYCK